MSHVVFEIPCLHRAMLLLEGEVRRLRGDKLGGGELCNQERGEPGRETG